MGNNYKYEMDFVTSWFAKAARYLKALQDQAEALGVTEVPGEFAFVSTNSIVQGAQVEPLLDLSLRQGGVLNLHIARSHGFRRQQVRQPCIA